MRRAPSHRVVGPGVDRPLLSGVVVVARDEAAVTPCEDDVRIVLTRGDPAALAAPHVVPILLRDPDAIGAGRDAHRAVVLLGAAQHVREVGGGDDVIELGSRLVALGGPRSAAVAADRRTAVVAVDHPRGVVRVGPQRVVIADPGSVGGVYGLKPAPLQAGGGGQAVTTPRRPHRDAHAPGTAPPDPTRMS